MIVELGHFALILALCVAVVQAVVPLVGTYRQSIPWMAVAPAAAATQFALILCAFAALIYAFVVSDFSVTTVVQNSHTDKPLIYKISGVWGNHEGSMVLWVLILALFGAMVAAFGRNLPLGLKARVLSVQGLIGVGFLMFILFTSNPFSRVDPAPVNGQSLNPLLQDIGLALHPPFLYLGYVGFSTAFSFAIAALLEGRVDPAWARWVRPWTLAAWCFMTIGIALGSWWAYYELGWGGWWFWDPVENASFMPWLAGTALLHSAVVVEKRDTLKAWTILLAIITFTLSLLGTFLVRSGVLTSVHTFASDPTRGIFILLLLLLVVGGSFALFAWRGPQLRSHVLFQPISREGGLLLNNLLLSIATAAVLLGTLYPLFLDVLDGPKISVGAPYFNLVFVPIMVPVIVAMAITPFLGWKRADLMAALGKLKIVFGVALAGALAVLFLAERNTGFAALGIALAVWLFLGSLWELAGRIRLFREPLSESLSRLRRQPRGSWGMTLGHAGLAVIVAGITASSAWTVERIQVMKPDESISIAGHEYVFKGVKPVRGPNYLADRGTFEVRKDGEVYAVLTSERRRYLPGGQETTEAGIEPTLWGDLYAVVGEQAEDQPGGWVTRLYFNPLIGWLWTGALLMVLGGFISLTDRRYRVGAPVGTRRVSSTAQPAE